MKGTPEVIASLNELLVEYHTSMVQFVTFSIFCSLSGYEKIEKKFDYIFREDEESMVELIKRISFLGGICIIDKLNELQEAESVEEMIVAGINLKLGSIASLTAGIEVAITFKDFSTRNMLEKMLVEEDHHLATLEATMIQFSEKG